MVQKLEDPADPASRRDKPRSRTEIMYRKMTNSLYSQNKKRGGERLDIFDMQRFDVFVGIKTSFEKKLRFLSCTKINI